MIIPEFSWHSLKNVLNISVVMSTYIAEQLLPGDEQLPKNYSRKWFINTNNSTNKMTKLETVSRHAYWEQEQLFD